MLYQLYEWNHAALTPFRAVADATRLFYQNPLNPLSHTTAGRSFAAMAELFERTTRIYGKPEFGLDETTIRGQRVPVVDKPVWSKPFCDLLHFERALPKGHGKDPRILVVAPMSGHYATLLRGTVEALLPYAEVYITDWKDARTVPLSSGGFDLDDYVDYVIEMLRFLGPDTHVIGVCQPAVPVLMATAVMEQNDDPCAPATMTLMGGPIDTRINPTAVNDLAKERGIDWFRDNVIMQVPFPHSGFMRQVYPGFLQLTGFMSMNLDRHVIAHKDFFWHLVKDDGDSAEKHRTFYDEYNAVMDMTAEFYLQTVNEVFVKHSLPKGEITHRGQRVDLTAIHRTGLLTVEGENDDISGVGQTEAAQDLCVNIPGNKRVHYVQPKVGHYGVFNGSRFRAEIAPRIVDFALTHGTTHTGATQPKAGEPAAGPRRMGAYAERIAKAGVLGRGVSGAGESGFGAAARLGSFGATIEAMSLPAQALMSGALEAANLSFGSFAGGNNSGFSAPYTAANGSSSRRPAEPAPVGEAATQATPSLEPERASEAPAIDQLDATEGASHELVEAPIETAPSEMAASPDPVSAETASPDAVEMPKQDDTVETAAGDSQPAGDAASSEPVKPYGEDAAGDADPFLLPDEDTSDAAQELATEETAKREAANDSDGTPASSANQTAVMEQPTGLSAAEPKKGAVASAAASETTSERPSKPSRPRGASRSGKARGGKGPKGPTRQR
ncbi:polyhydroxyalkanoate depolymerase [Jiella sp. 40Bstr34]|uniref:Polyhydroxyalkanoate depolymerase n=1 Tax=Jiella pacifica TaxID=2696469 RepID=A0A6N9T273_9HYPH|nr:polyhydroxyalkanoate depolymerase [Jiella pacifica]